MTEESAQPALQSTNDESGYRRKPPLWQSKSGRPSTPRDAAIVIGTMISVSILFAVAFEKDLLSVPMGQTEVVVIRVQDEKPQGSSARRGSGTS